MNFEEFKQQIMEDLPGALPERLSNVEIEPVSVAHELHVTKSCVCKIEKKIMDKLKLFFEMH